ncbi:MAG: response regulator [Lachnospiraceae bacterium]|jgi:CheY-like chemotaxis protein|nr:response regulator [Lachnospiraceae bacterium]
MSLENMNDHESMSAKVDRKRLEEQNEHLRHALAKKESVDQARTNYIAQMVRNIRIPMNTITGTVAIARKNVDDSKRLGECLDKIEFAGLQLTELIGKITDMSELSDRVMVLEEKPFMLKDELKLVADSFMARAKCKAITLRVTADEIVHEHLQGDKGRIGQVIGNLITNAVNYTMPGGTVDVTVREVHTFRDGMSLFCFEVADTGVGMATEFLQNMYQPFVLADDPRISREQGVGLGLSIVLRLVRMMSGDISVVSEPGVGTKFTVMLHIKHYTPQGNPTPIWNSGPVVNNLAGKRMLVAEDNELNAEVIKELLEQHGVVVDRAENGIRVLDMLYEKEDDYYDCILMDVQMPVMNGYEATHKIRRSERPDLHRIPIIAMTADAFSGDIRSAKNAGMDEHMAKPVNVMELMEVFLRVLK